MGFKDIFIKSDNNQPVQNQQKNQAAPVYQSAQPEVNIPVTPVSGVDIPTGALGTTPLNVISADPGIVEKLWKAIINENRPGPDYLELKNNVEALEDMPMTADQKILGAFKILQKQYPSFKKEDIDTAVKYYIDVVNREKEKGLSELKQIRTDTVDTVANSIAEKQQELSDLRQKMTELQNEIAELNSNMLKAKSEVDEKEEIFKVSVEAVLSVLNSDISKIQTINF